MTTTADRLQLYLDHEAALLTQGQQVRDDRGRQKINAELRDVRESISRLQNQLAREQRASTGGGSLGFAVASVSSGGH